MIRTRPWLLILLAALAYAFGHFYWYAATPLGRVPVLDELENVTLANQIASSSLPPEPFYRAMGYPLLLAALRWVGVQAFQLPFAALLLGVLLHAATALLIAALARRWFDDTRVGLVAGLLAALNPVFVHFATQRLDAELGTVLFLAGLLSLALERKRPAPRDLFTATFWWTLAALTRPQFLTVLPALLVLWWWRDDSRRRRRNIVVSLALTAGLFATHGLWQRHVSGEFRLLPWQVSYNLWTANQLGAHGRYYEQAPELQRTDSPENPAKAESLLQYRNETGRAVVTSDGIDAMNAHWRARLFDFVLHHPLQWLGQLTRKTYAFLNTWEQYNDKTYAFHQARSPWLAWNPLGWGVLLVLAPAGGLLLRTHDRRIAYPAVGLVVVASASVVLFFVSARFRLPIAALLCIPAGATLARPIWFFRALSLGDGAKLVAVSILAGFVAFSDFDGVRDRRPYVQDHLLVARAAQAVGDDATVWAEATAASMLAPNRHDADEFLVTSGFNRQLTTALNPSELATWHQSATRLLAAPAAGSPLSRVIAAAATRDLATLQEFTTDPAAIVSVEALGALVLLDATTPAQTTRFRSTPRASGIALSFMARQALDAPSFAAWAELHEPPGWSKALATARARLFPARSTSP